MKVLFVDDEPAILESLSDAMRPHRTNWSARFASSGREALELLEREPHEMIVSDMRMPGMDGAELLAHVHDKYPTMTRFILTGHSDENAILRAYPVTHQILAKPCDANHIARAIQDVIALRSKTHSKYVNDFVGRFHVLPTLEETYVELIRLLTSSASAQQISIALSKDSVFASRILQLANSPYFGSTREVVSLVSAVNIVGHNLIRTLLMAYQAGKMCRDKSRRQIAMIADETERISNVIKILLFRTPDFEEALSVAIVNNVGKYAMLSADPVVYGQLLSDATETGTPLNTLEIRQYGASHAEVGAFLLALWGLPIGIVKAVANRYNAEEFRQSPTHYALHLADEVHFSESTGEMLLPAAYEAEDPFGFHAKLKLWNLKFNGQFAA